MLALENKIAIEKALEISIYCKSQYQEKSGKWENEKEQQ